MFHTALGAGAKPYYVLPAVRIGSCVLGYVQAEIFLQDVLGSFIVNIEITKSVWWPKRKDTCF